jgi:hypothetical protein
LLALEKTDNQVEISENFVYVSDLSLLRNRRAVSKTAETINRSYNLAGKL